MIDPDRRKAIYQLHLAGMPQRQISRQFHVSPHTVRTIIRQQGALPQTVRKDKIHIDPGVAAAAVPQCDGWLQRSPRDAGGGREGPGQLSHLDAGGAGVGAGQARQSPLRSRAGRTGCRDAARHHGVQGETGGPADAGHRQPVVPAVLEAAVLEVLPGVQPLRHEVLPARGA